MKRLLLLVLFAIGVSWSTAFAAERSTPDEAKAMAEKAAAYLKENGPEKSFPVFQAKDGGFQDRDLYVTVADSKGVMLANGAMPALIGKNLIDLKDVEGKPFEREVVAVKDAAWVEFKWRNPMSNAVELKRTYQIRVGDYVVGVGAYVP
ncbi:MAG TPA: cache domain-containing protein [Stellaceae bacterium]|nr:cache domain-containing protein [Stellaceae bacterium]